MVALELSHRLAASTRPSLEVARGAGMKPSLKHRSLFRWLFPAMPDILSTETPDKSVVTWSALVHGDRYV